MVTKKKIAVLMGGHSAEREVSLKSGQAIEASLRRLGYTVVAMDVDDRTGEQLRKEKVALAVNVLHGRGGEDGAIQGFLETMGIPYTGSGIMASAIGMNKIMTKRLLESVGIATPRFFVLRGSRKADGSVVYPTVKFPTGFSCPVVVKPAAEGSAIGVTIVKDAASIDKACAEAFRCGDEILIEEYIEGQEVTVGIVGEKPLPVIEIIPKEAFYNYKAKYTKGMTQYVVPANLPKGLTSKIQGMALKVHQLIGCRGCTRTDFRIDRNGRPLVLEINTVPGMTETSLLPKAAEAIGVTYDDLVSRMLQMAETPEAG